MDVQNALLPRPEQIANLLALGGEAPVVMLNLLKFRDIAIYDDDRPPISGREAYALYAAPMRELVESRGGRLIFTGRIDALAIGEVGELWDVAALMEYPSRAAFAAIAADPEVARLARHRTAGLAGQLLIQVSQATNL